MSLSHIFHNGKRIVLMDYSKCKSEAEMLKSLNEFADYFRNSKGGELALSDFTNAFGTLEFMKEAKRMRTEVFYPKTAKAAVVGVAGAKRILLNAYNKIANRELKSFETKEEALDFLAED